MNHPGTEMPGFTGAHGGRGESSRRYADRPARLLSKLEVRQLLRETGFVPGFQAAQEAAMAAVPFNNPHAALIAGDDFQGRHFPAIHQKRIKLFIRCAGALIIVTFIKARLYVYFVNADKHPAVSAGNDFILNHFFK